jgi:hypothetical protein
MDTDYNGYARHANVDDPQYEIHSNKIDRVAMRKSRRAA